MIVASVATVAYACHACTEKMLKKSMGATAFVHAVCIRYWHHATYAVQFTAANEALYALGLVFRKIAMIVVLQHVVVRALFVKKHVN